MHSPLRIEPAPAGAPPPRLRTQTTPARLARPCESCVVCFAFLNLFIYRHLPLADVLSKLVPLLQNQTTQQDVSERLDLSCRGEFDACFSVGALHALRSGARKAAAHVRSGARPVYAGQGLRTRGNAAAGRVLSHAAGLRCVLRAWAGYPPSCRAGVCRASSWRYAVPCKRRTQPCQRAAADQERDSPWGHRIQCAALPSQHATHRTE